MQSIQKIFDILEALLGPNGCQWDKKQTLSNFPKYFLEETHEVVEAIDHLDNTSMMEEVGDLLFTLCFFAKLAENENRFSFDDMVFYVCEKMIRRHPHVFHEKQNLSKEEVAILWKEIKQKEKPERKSVLDEIPKTLPTLMKIEKLLNRTMPKDSVKSTKSKDELQKNLEDLLKEIVASKNSPEEMCRMIYSQLEKEIAGDDLKA